MAAAVHASGSIPITGGVSKPAWGSKQGGKQNVSEAKRNAEALFENKTVSDIREIEMRTRKDIEAKKLQLRQLVGDSYRDLMESADQIVGISNDCGTIMHNIKFIQGGFSSLAHSFTSADTLLHEKRDSLTKHEELYAVGSRIKYMIDTPEMIWGFLDSRQYLEGACRFLRSQHVHAILPKSFAPDVLTKFPLLSHQWPLVEKFKKQIIDAVAAFLSQDVDLATGNVACALAAACYLRNLDSAAALQLLLSSRRAWIKQSLAAAAEGGGAEGGGVAAVAGGAPGLATAAVAPSLCAIANAVQMTIAQVGELFLTSGSRSGAEAACMLQLAVREDEMDRSELMFAGCSSSALPSAGANAVAAPEAEAWKRTNQKMQAQLGALTSGQVEKLCTQWVREVSEDLSSACAPLLQSGCSSAEELVAVEGVIRASIGAWRHPAAAAAAPQRKASLGGATRLSVPNVTSFSTAAASGAAALSGLPLDPALLSWETASEWILGAPMSLWNESFHTPFTRHAKDLIAASFSSVAASVQAPLLECLAAAATAPPEPAGEMGSGRWPFAAPEGLTAAAKGLGGEGSFTGTPCGGRMASLAVMSAAWSDAPAGARMASSLAVKEAGYRQRIHSIRVQFDQELHCVLRAVVVLLKSPEGGGGKGGSRRTPSGHVLDPMTGGHVAKGSDGGALGEHGHAGGSTNRRAELEPYVQQCCTELTAHVAAELAAKLEVVGMPATGVQGAPAAEQVLLIGRLCSALAGDSRMLAIVLGPPEAWRQQAVSGVCATSGLMPVGRHGGRGGAARQPAACSPLTSAVERFRATAVASYTLWSKWAAASLSAQLRLSLSREDVLAVVNTPPSWQETVILSSSMSGGSSSGYDADGSLADPMADMHFSLPACASSALMAYLSAACRELCRAGDHTVGTDALQAIEWELAGAALSTYSHLLHSEASGSLGFSLSEKGVLQLLFDVRLMRDVFSGGRPLTLSKCAAEGGAGGVGKGGGSMVELQDPAMAAATSARRKEVASLEAQLQDRLDPIDWATYEPYLWTGVRHYYQRTSVLFGSLIQLQRAHPESMGKASSTASIAASESNPLNMMPVVPRFQYLPISAPIASSHHAGSAAAGGLSGMSLVMSMGQPVGGGGFSGSSGDIASSFTFSDLGSGRNGAGSASSPHPMQQTGSAGMPIDSSYAGGAFGALQARLQAGSLSTFGSILGDKAAEMTAMAQQRFDITDFSALGSGLLSTFTKR